MSSNTPVVSVIISTYNRSDLLPIALRSILSQKFDAFEIIVIDAGTTEETTKVVKAFSEPRIRYFQFPGLNLPAGRNAGIAESRGKYVTFLDDDDRFLPDKLTTQVSFMETHRNLGWSSGGYLLTSLDGKMLAEWCPWRNYPKLDTTTWLFSCPTGVAAVMVHRSWIEQIGGFDSTHDVTDDWDMWLRLAYAGCKMAWVEEVLFEYHIHQTNMIRDIHRIERRRIGMLEKFFHQDNLPPHIASLKNKAFAQAYLESSCRKYAAGYVTDARMDLEQAVIYNPNYLANSGDYILEVLCSEAQRVLNEDANAVMENALTNLPPIVAAIPRIVPRGRAKLAMSQFFGAAQRQDRAKMRRLLPRALLRDPKWLLNRGVWSLGASAFFGPKTMQHLRSLNRQTTAASNACDASE